MPVSYTHLDVYKRQVYALLLLLPMQRRGEGVLDRTMGLDLVKMLLAAAVTGLAAAGVLSLLTGVLPGGKIGELLSLGGCLSLIHI